MLYHFYVALNLPLALVCLFQPSELLNGFFLHSGTSTPLKMPLHKPDTHGQGGKNKTKPLRSASTHMNQTGHTLVDLPEDAVAGDWGKSSKAHRCQCPVLIIPRTTALATRGSRFRSFAALHHCLKPHRSHS